MAKSPGLKSDPIVRWAHAVLVPKWVPATSAAPVRRRDLAINAVLGALEAFRQDADSADHAVRVDLRPSAHYRLRMSSRNNAELDCYDKTGVTRQWPGDAGTSSVRSGFLAKAALPLR